VSYKGLLVAAIIVGLLVAAFPFYVDYVKGYAPIYYSGGEEEEEETYVVKGVVESVDAAQGVIVVDGKSILVKGEWSGEGETLYYSDLLAKVKPGMSVTVYCRYSERWGYMAEEIVLPGGVTYEKEE